MYYLEIKRLHPIASFSRGSKSIFYIKVFFGDIPRPFTIHLIVAIILLTHDIIEFLTVKQLILISCNTNI